MRSMMDGFTGWMRPQPETRETCAAVDMALVLVLGCWIVMTWLLLLAK